MDVSYDQSVKGRTVIDSQGRVLGQVDGLVIDSESWSVRFLRVKLEKDVSDTIGEPRGTFRAAVIDVPAEAVSGVGDTVVLSRPIASLAGESMAATADAAAGH
jgi:sporulation protein YlmC with PRC-barrel domain